ncbi:G-protein coupled receptor [Biomphalaria pfeifferi]|uniref:G-protein coupled receptor n=1 Tax=Biomphalaria pfeifferi TaxID=112525 RepID=A0AAD8C7N7_BIOPF|nr:G-protein coupled receptor [Biomphalaria pfeifferi]
MENVSYLVTKEFTVQNATFSWEKTTLSYEAYYVCWFQTSSYEEYITYLGMMCYVNPAVSFVGLISNMISLAILRRSGLHKPSNILLFGLVIADSMCLSTTLNYGIILFYFGPNKPFSRLCGFQYVDSLNVYLAVTSIIMEFIGFWGQYVNTWIPILITLERLLAIFRPMTFKSIVTKRRTIALQLSFHKNNNDIKEQVEVINLVQSSSLINKNNAYFNVNLRHFCNNTSNPHRCGADVHESL